MNRAEREITAPIKRDELHRLLNTMTPEQEQAITTRTGILDIQAELARVVATAEPVQCAMAEAEVPRLFDGVDWDELLTETVSRMVTPRAPKPVPPPFPRSSTAGPRPKRKYARPFAQVAALLPRSERPRSPLAARRSPSTGTRIPTRSLAVTEQQKAPRTVAELRARLDSGETPAVWADSSVLSPQVLAHLSAEEIAMLPAEIRGAVPEGPAETAPPRSELTAVPCEEVDDLLFEWGAAPVPELELEPEPERFAAIIASVASLFLVGVCAAYFLV